VNRLRQLDILRAIAVVLVLGRHMTPCPTNDSSLLHGITYVWGQGGWVGVDLFFVLSGFLVSGLLFQEYERHRELRIWRFLVRRGFKIYPPFWLMIVATIVIGALRHRDIPPLGVLSELLFLQNYWLSLWNHTWSLAVEEHFYLLLAFGMLLAAQGRRDQPFRRLPVAFAIVALLCLLLRILAAANVPYAFRALVFPSHLRLDGLFFGVLLSYLLHCYPNEFRSAARRFRYVLLGIGLLMLAPAFCYPLETTPSISTYGLTLFYIASGCLLVSALGFPAPTGLCARAVAYVGSHSYSIYLWHMPVAAWGIGTVTRLLSLEDNWFLYFVAYFAGAIVFGVAMSLLVEFPTLRFRDRYFPSRGAAVTINSTGSSAR
jgi:peptidoglycan/LPS O-acetylase OafA/YrhL